MIKTDATGRHFSDHTPGAVLDYSIDWSDWLATGETITSSTWVVNDGVTLSAQSSAGAVQTIFVSGGIDGRQYVLINFIETNQGRKDSRAITLRCVIL